MRLSALCVLLLAACGGSPRPLAAQVATGPASSPPGGVLVFASECANMEVHCPMNWSPTVDAIVTSGLSFHGYQTIDPEKLRKDEGQRTETVSDANSHTETTTNDTTGGVGMVGIIPIASITTSSGKTVIVHESHERTVVLVGATLEDLTLPDRKSLMDLVGARSLLTTQIIVGANWSTWGTSQSVEVMVKLADANTGEMRWSARCAASSGDYPSAAAALEAAAHCVVDALTSPAA